MRKIMMFFAFFGLLGMQVFAQKTITGTVTKASDGSTLPGISVVVKGTTIATVTGIDGDYTLNNVPETATSLVFSGMSMKEVEKPITGDVVDCAMEEEAIDVGDVVVTALGITRDEKAIGYSATSVDGDDFAKNSSVNMMNSLQGKVAGVSVTSSGGSPGASTKVIIRGYSSVKGNNNPLYVIDGVPVDNGSRGLGGVDFGNRGNDVNPNDIENMTILKGAAATAQYGPRGANGVVMITTKKGALDQDLNVSINSSFTVSDVLRLPQMQNTFGQGWSGHWAIDENGSWGPLMDGKERAWGNVYKATRKVKPFEAQKDNLYDFYDYGYQFDNSVSISGGDKNSTFYVSYGNMNADGVIPTDADSYNKNTIRANASRKGKIFDATVSSSFVRSNGSLTPDGLGGTSGSANLYSELLQIPRDFSVIEFKDYKNDPFNTADYFYTLYAYNPYFALNENKAKFFENRFYGSVTLDVKIAKWLKFSYRPGVDASATNIKRWEAILKFAPGTPSFDGGVKENPGYVFEDRRISTKITQDFIFAAEHKFGDISVNGLLGYQTYNASYNRLYSYVNSLVIPNFYNLANTDGLKQTATYLEQKRTYGVFAQADLGFKDFAYLTLSGRQDYSSTLPKDNNSFFYPSASLSLLINNMVPSMKSFADLVKLRISWGKAGNDADPYQLYTAYDPGYISIPWSSIKFPFGDVSGFEKTDQLGSLDLKPEITTEQEIGLALNLFKRRVNIDVALYNRISDGQILPVPTAPSSGYPTRIANFGKVQNKGVELLATFVPVRAKNSFEWSFSVNFTKNTNKVTDLPGEKGEVILQYAYGVEMVAIKDKPLGVIRAPGFTKTDDGKIVVSSTTGIQVPTTDKVELGTIQPKYILGLTNSLSFKGFTFGFTFDIRQGGLMYSGTADLNYFVGNATKTTYNYRQPFIVPNSVVATGDPNNPTYVENTMPIYVDKTNTYYYPSGSKTSEQMRVIPRSFVKLRNVSLSYDIPTKALSKVNIKGLSILLSANNLLLWTPVDNNFIDPESTSFGNDLKGAFGEFRTGPTLRSFTGGIRLKF